MIKVGILGAATPVAGEIIRILVHHPEVELRTLHAPSLAGHPATSAHHGLWGEETLLFTEKADFYHLDVAIICGSARCNVCIARHRISGKSGRGRAYKVADS